MCRCGTWAHGLMDFGSAALMVGLDFIGLFQLNNSMIPCFYATLQEEAKGMIFEINSYFSENKLEILNIPIKDEKLLKT